MKKTKFLGILVLIIVVLSCKKDDDQVVEKDKLVSATLLKSISEDEAKAMFALAKQVFPEIPDYAQQVISGIKVYYVEYASTYVDGEPIVLSGLVCAPDDASRNSMIVSIQNGTLVKHS
ncbi:MAG: hypothetical protein KAS29_06680, partial [Bacteroidales bacterium]|nr:hypothetical protein [Bacteroidales bacterium]